MNPFPTAQAGTALSPEWDHGFDEAFADLITGDPDLVQAEFEAMIGAAWGDPPPPPSPPAPATSGPDGSPPGTTGPASAGEQAATAPTSEQRSPP